MKKYLEINRIAYDELARDYYTRCCNQEKDETPADAFVEFILPYVSEDIPYSEMSVLEIGPGSGKVLSCFSRLGFHTTAIELSPNMAEISHRQSPQSHIIVGDANSVKMEMNHFDIIFMGAVLHLFPIRDAEKLLRRVYKWLKPNGILFVNTTCALSEYEGYYIKHDYGGDKIRFRRFWTEKRFINVLIQNNFVIIRRLYSTETLREKRWVAAICKKVTSNGR